MKPEIVKIFFECKKNTYDIEKEKTIQMFFEDVANGFESVKYHDKDYVQYIGNGVYHITTWIKWYGFDEDGDPVIEEVSKKNG